MTPNQGVFRVKTGQNLKTFKPFAFTYCLERSEKLRREVSPQIASSEARGSEERLVDVLPRAKRDAKTEAWSTNCLEQSEMLRRETGPPIASSEASSLEERLVNKLPRAKRED